MAREKRPLLVPIPVGAQIGEPGAEFDDKFLFDAFVRNRVTTIALDTDSPVMILAGRTGSGKTAILRYTEENRRTSRIVPADAAMQYVTNTEIIKFLNDIGADLRLFFVLIWKHVLVIEFIKARHETYSADRTRGWLQRIGARLRGRGHDRGLAYLDKYEDSLWKDLDENVRTITDQSAKKSTHRWILTYPK